MEYRILFFFAIILIMSLAEGNSICEQPKKVGICKASMPRFWYNSAKKKCEMFIFGGCLGNDNNFPNLTECENTCRNGWLTCKQPKRSGSCPGYFPSYWYDYKTNTCKEFIYSGCKGNDNRFSSLWRCEFACVSSP